MKLLPFFLFLILLCSSIYAVKPSTPDTFAGSKGLDIKLPPFDIITQDRNFEFEFHVYNLSNGHPITDGIVCYFHLYNDSGKHIVILQDDTTSHTFDYSFDIYRGNFTRLGEYAYVVQCNNSVVGGFASVDMHVSKDGKLHDVLDNSSGLAVVIFLIVLNLALFLVPLKHEILKSNVGDFMVKKSLILLGMFVLSLNIATVATIADSSNLPVLQTLFRYLWVINWGIFLMSIYIIVSTIFKVLELWAEEGKQKRMGEYDD